MTPKDTKAAANNTKPDKKDSQIDFSKLTIGQQDSTDKSPDLNKTEVKSAIKTEVKPEIKKEKSADIMSSANKEEDTKQTLPQIDMNQLTIPTAKNTEHIQKVELGDSGIDIEMYGRRFEVSYRRIFLTSFFVIFLFGLLSVFLGSYSKYIKVSTSPVIEPIYQTLVEKYDEYEQRFSKYIRFSDYENYLNMNIYGPRTEQNLEKILSEEKISYIHKKNIIQNNLDNLTQSTFEQLQDLNILKQEISKFGFLSEELYTILAGQKQIQPIKKSLLSLEVIKFSSAMRVFSYLDTFLEGFASVVKLPTETIGSHLQNVMERGENDIYVYLNNCYLNPFERDYDCKAIGDFDLYYELIQEDSSFNKDHFKQLIKYIDLKLEQTEIPSFSIVFRRFDPSKDQITFSIDVNTFQKDEIALLQKNILNPHVFVVTQLLNLLKQSIFVVGESIDIKKLDVQNKVVQIGSQQFNINNSKMSFSLPIQKSTQREIFDFVESMDNRYEGSKTLQITQDMNQLNNQIDTTHSSANIISGEEAGSVNYDDELQDVLGNNVSYVFSEYYARKLLNLQKEDARIKYILQEQGEALVIQERAAQIELLQYVDGFTQEEIQGVFDYIVESNLFDSVVIDVGLLRQKNDTGEMLFEVLQSNQSSQEANDAAEGEAEGEEIVESKTGFAQVRDFFSSGTIK